MDVVEKVRNALGLNTERALPTPVHQLICDGLLFTEDHTEAWFTVGVQNLDTAAEAAWDESLDSVKKSMLQAVGESNCMIRIMWSEHRGEDYLRSVEGNYDPNWGNGAAWAADYASKIDELHLPARTVMLGVNLGERTSGPARLMRKTEKAFGFQHGPVSDSELADAMVAARKILKVLAASPLAVELASVEAISWMLSRESGRAKARIPATGTVRGAALGHLLASKMVPHPDHVELFDEHDNLVAFKAILPIVSFPEELTAPGNADWVEVLSRITKIREVADGYGLRTEEVPVRADATIRFNNLSRQSAGRMVNEARRTAKEQRQSAAKGSAEEVPEEVEEAETANARLLTQIKKGGTFLVEQSSRVIVSASSLEELEENIDAVTHALGEEDIIVARGENEQRDLWLENLPGDAQRVTDLNHIQTSNGFYGTFFWAGSRCGDEQAGMSGFVHGTTVEPFRSSISSAGERGDTTSTLYSGRSGRGKTTAMMLELLSDLVERPAWTVLFDWKGDTGGAALVARHYKIPASIVELGEEHSGAADMFRAFSRAQAPIAVQSMLMMQAKDRRQADVATSASLRFATEEAEEAEVPSTWGVIKRMAASGDPDVQAFASYLLDLAKTPIGRIVMGEPTANAGLSSEPGLWIVQAAGLSLPSPEISFSDWDAQQRLSVALIQGMTSFALGMSSSKALRAMRKTVAVPEVHILLRATGGAAFLDQIARMGRAFNTSLVYDTQDCTSILALPGLVEQLQGVRVFQLTTRAQQDAAAELLGLEPSEQTRARILALGRDETDIRKVAKGRALVRDWRDQVAEVQFVFPSQTVQDLLSTDPNATKKKEEMES